MLVRLNYREGCNIKKIENQCFRIQRDLNVVQGWMMIKNSETN